MQHLRNFGTFKQPNPTALRRYCNREIRHRNATCKFIVGWYAAVTGCFTLREWCHCLIVLGVIVTLSLVVELSPSSGALERLTVK